MGRHGGKAQQFEENLPDGCIRIDYPQRVRALGKIESVEFVVPDIDKAELVGSSIVEWALEQRSRYVEIGLRQVR